VLGGWVAGWVWLGGKSVDGWRGGWVGGWVGGYVGGLGGWTGRREGRLVGGWVRGSAVHEWICLHCCVVGSRFSILQPPGLKTSDFMIGCLLFIVRGFGHRHFERFGG